MAPSSSTDLRRGEPATPCVTVFCLPYAGGSSRNFRPWQDHLPPSIHAVPLELPGRGTRIAEPPEADAPTLVEELTDMIAEHDAGSFALFGHSMGALLAFEVSRLLPERAGLEPVHLFASGYRAPHLPNRMLPLHDLPSEDFVRALRRFNGTPEEVLNDAEVMDVMLPILRADFAVTDTYRYRPGPRLRCDITVFGGVDDDHVKLDDLVGWRVHTSGRSVVKLVSGDHFFVNTSLPLVVRHVAECLAQHVRHVGEASLRHA